LYEEEHPEEKLYQCSVVDAPTAVTYSARKECYDNGTFIGCPNVVSNARYATFNIHSDSKCFHMSTAASNIYGSYFALSANCQPWDFLQPVPPFIMANCTFGAESLSFYEDSKCTKRMTGNLGQKLMLDKKCNRISFVLAETYIRGTCKTCVTSDSSLEQQLSSEGLSAGAIAGIVIGSVTAVAAVGGLAFFLMRNRHQQADHVAETGKAAGIKSIEVVKCVEPVPAQAQVPPRRQTLLVVPKRTTTGITRLVSDSVYPTTQLPAYQTRDPNYPS